MPSTSRSPIAKLQREERDLRWQAVTIRRKLHGAVAIAHAAGDGSVNLFDVALEGEIGQQDEIALRRLADRIQALADAREQLRQGSYGTCRDCGCRIPQRRLEAMPTATLCVRCQEEFEASRAP